MALRMCTIRIFVLHSHRNITRHSYKIVFTFSLYFALPLFILFLCLSFLSVFHFFLSFSVRPFWKRCQHCCFYTKRLLLGDGWRQPQLQRRACVCLAAEGRSHWKGQNWEELLVTAMKTLTSTNRIAISNNCTIYSEWLMVKVNLSKVEWWGLKKKKKIGETVLGQSPPPFLHFFFSLSLSPFLSPFNPRPPLPRHTQ